MSFPPPELSPEGESLNGDSANTWWFCYAIAGTIVSPRIKNMIPQQNKFVDFKGNKVKYCKLKSYTKNLF